MQEDNLPTGTLGIERWVQFAFIGTALVVFWMFDNLFQNVAELVARKANLAELNPTIVTGLSAIAGIATAYSLYRHPKINKFSREVAVELARVTWPTRKETASNTFVVFVVSLLAAVILGVMDAFWKSLTDIIY